MPNRQSWYFNFSFSTSHIIQVIETPQKTPDSTLRMDLLAENNFKLRYYGMNRMTIKTTLQIMELFVPLCLLNIKFVSICEQTF